MDYVLNSYLPASGGVSVRDAPIVSPIAERLCRASDHQSSDLPGFPPAADPLPDGRSYPRACFGHLHLDHSERRTAPAAPMIGQKLGSFRIERSWAPARWASSIAGSRRSRTSPPPSRSSRSEQMGKGKASERFIREAEILEQFRHPNIVRYMGRGPVGRHVLLRDGVHHRPDARQGPPRARGVIPWREVAKIGVQLCEALHYSPTSTGVIHRDLKPSNLMVTEKRPAQADRLRDRQGPRRHRADRRPAGPWAPPPTWPPSRSEGRPRSATRPTSTPWAPSSTTCSPASPPFSGPRRS